MHKAIEVLEELGLVSERHLLQVEDFDKKTTVRTYERIYSAVHDAQDALPQSDATTIDPFTFLAVHLCGRSPLVGSGFAECKSWISLEGMLPYMRTG